MLLNKVDSMLQCGKEECEWSVMAKSAIYAGFFFCFFFVVLMYEVAVS